ncbi:hypothetical protein DLAC_03517 [Tieghemostelium lacteum]|uniref:RNA-binding protein NOB1 n=1 Tax=Tieghemostelium lacteum TaxID=361077 RepID=A0A152A1C9_TIELA|nr:hypothetical protein DLAC_03517 [Tieghemostelium lacteum]|eukprot:KYR00020.1 hypothetical protein DLAC_03517 [Tieghemostelium lacteum]
MSQITEELNTKRESNKVEEEEIIQEYDEELTEEQLAELNNLVQNDNTDPFQNRGTTDGQTDADTIKEIEDKLDTLAITNEKTTANYLVIDTNAIISWTKFETLAKELYTIPEVLEEVKDKQSQDFLSKFPFEIKTRVPTPESIKAVVDFSLKTGDYPSLSTTDIKVIALAYTIEAEINGISHIKTSPHQVLPKKPINKNNNNNQNNQNNNNQNKKKKKKKNNKNKNKTTTTTTTATTTTTTTTTETIEGDHGHDHALEHKDEVEEVKAADVKVEGENAKPNVSGKKAKKNLLKVDLTKIEEQVSKETVVDPKEVLRQFKIKQQEEEEERRKNITYKQEEEGEWITPDNIQTRLTYNQSTTTAMHFEVGLITRDFSMQNVILQMGLNLISVDGMVIKQVKQFVLKCVACNNFTTDMTRIFCEQCGNKSLFKATTYIDRNGILRVSQGSAKQFNLRGTIYSIPKLKGGKHNNDIILTEDQYLKKLKVTGQFYKKKATNDDFDLGFSTPTLPSTNVVIGYGNKNPNLARKKIGKKNKSISLH